MGARTPLTIVVAGLWHLGCVTAACCARYFRVIGLDADAPTVQALQEGRAPIAEPGLDALLREGLDSGSLSFTTDAANACRDADLLWVTHDTPVDENDASDVQAVLAPLQQILPHLNDQAWVLVSSQLPVGTCRTLETRFPRLQVACSPENLRLGKAIDAFTRAERVVVGTRHAQPPETLQTLFRPFTEEILWMRTESAEMVKHGLNGFLALSITFINEMARLCEKTGADAREVARGLKSDPRIGPRAYLHPGGPFAGGTLARDVVTLSRLGDSFQESLQVIPAIKRSNDQHRAWNWQRLQSRFDDLQGIRVALLGLTYKPRTNTLRRSSALELARQLLQAGAEVHACDPAVTEGTEGLPEGLILGRLDEALRQADAAVVSTEWPEFQDADWPALVPLMRRPLVLDANGFLEKHLHSLPHVEHLCVGRSS